MANRSEMLMLSRQYESQGERLKATEAVAEQQRLLAASLADAGTKAAAEAKAERRKSSEVEGRAAAARRAPPPRRAPTTLSAISSSRYEASRTRAAPPRRRRRRRRRAPPTSCASRATHTRELAKAAERERRLLAQVQQSQRTAQQGDQAAGDRNEADGAD